MRALKKFDTSVWQLLLLTTFSVLLLVARISYTGSIRYIFLVWNLFLAILPWLCSRYFVHIQQKKKLWQVIVLLSVWLLFFPNSPYILTDLFHLHGGKELFVWFDLILILSFAWTGLLFGFLSLLEIEKIALQYMSSAKVTTLIIALLFTSSFGVYLGRFLRWNSWDIISNPLGLFSDIGDRFLQPWLHHRTWGLTLLMGSFLSLMYYSIKALRQDEVKVLDVLPQNKRRRVLR